MKKKIFIGLILVIIIVSSGILFTVANSPKNVFTRSLAKNIENIVEREELVKVLSFFLILVRTIDKGIKNSVVFRKTFLNISSNNSIFTLDFSAILFQKYFAKIQPKNM